MVKYFVYRVNPENTPCLRTVLTLHYSITELKRLLHIHAFLFPVVLLKILRLLESCSNSTYLRASMTELNKNSFIRWDSVRLVAAFLNFKALPLFVLFSYFVNCVILMSCENPRLGPKSKYFLSCNYSTFLNSFSLTCIGSKQEQDPTFAWHSSWGQLDLGGYTYSWVV